MPVLVPDSPGARPQLWCCRGAPHPPVFPGCPQGERGPSSSGRWDREAGFCLGRQIPLPALLTSETTPLAIPNSSPPVLGALGQLRTLFWATVQALGSLAPLCSI